MEEFIPAAQALLSKKTNSVVAFAQKKLNAVWDIIFTMPVYRDLNMDLKLSYHLLERLYEQKEKWTQVQDIHSEGHEIYDPCAPGSRLGITREALDKAIKNGLDLSRIEGFHFHTLCEQDSDALETTLAAVEEKFGDLLYGLKWLNMGGGHHITRADYDIERLEKCIMHMRDKYDLEIYLEPGEAVALDAGYLETTVLDIVENNGIKILILDTSAACHMPDVLEMPYRPPLMDSGEPGEKKYTYRLSSCTCLAGDVIGDYSFDREIKTGDRLCFCDMAIYSMVKNNTFNGMPLPAIYSYTASGQLKLIKNCLLYTSPSPRD